MRALVTIVYSMERTLYANREKYIDIYVLKDMEIYLIV